MVSIGDNLSATPLRYAALSHSIQGSAEEWAELPKYHPHELDVLASAPVHIAPLDRLPPYKRVITHGVEAALAILRASQAVSWLQVLPEALSSQLIDELVLACVRRGVPRLQVVARGFPPGAEALLKHPMADAGWIVL